MTDDGSRPLARVLALHGFAQDAETFRGKIGAIRKALKSTHEFVLLDAPHDVRGAFSSATELASLGASSAGTSRAWFTSGESARAGASRSTDEGWTRPALSREYVGFDESLAAIRTVIEERGPFDGVIGFSQGATCAVAALAAIEELRTSARFVVLVAGFEPLDENMLASVRAAAPLAMKSLHVHGESDALVTRERMTSLAEHFAAASREFWFHDGAHGVPSSALAKFLKTWLAPTS